MIYTADTILDRRSKQMREGEPDGHRQAEQNRGIR